MNIYRENAELIRTDKKQNVHYWDHINADFEDCVITLLESLRQYDMKDTVCDDECVLDIYKRVVDVVIPYLEKHCGAEFPYVDENF